MGFFIIKKIIILIIIIFTICFTFTCSNSPKKSCHANIAIPTGGAISAIAVAISENGETRPTSTAIFTPTAVEVEGNVTSTAIITVPRGCCFNVAVRYVDATVEDAAVTPTPTIEVQNANLVINRIA